MLVVALAAVACASDADNSGPDVPTPSEADTDLGPSGTITVGAAVDKITFDPHLTEIGHYLQYLQPVYDTLLRETPDGELVPMLATDWLYNDDRTSLELQLRDDVTFVDGTPFNADVVKANVERGQESVGPRTSALAGVDSVEVLDDTTVRFDLAGPDPMLLRELSSVMGMMISPAAFENPDLDLNPVGSGPFVYRPEQSSDGDRYVFEANPDYWDPSLQGVERIEIVVISDPNARLNALIAEQIDMASGSGAEPQAADAEAAGIQILTEPVNWSGLNLADRDGELVPALADPRVRQAMNHAIDRQAIIDGLSFGFAVPATQIFPHNHPANIDPEGNRFPFDPERARELLADAGYEDGFTISVPVQTVDRVADNLTAMIGYLADVGIEMDIQLGDSAQMLDSWSDTDSPIKHFTFGPRHPDEMIRQFILDDGTYNPFQTQKPGIAELLDEAARLPEDEAANRYAEIAEIITDDAWFLVGSFLEVVYFVGPRVEGVRTQPQQVVPSIYGWRVHD